MCPNGASLAHRRVIEQDGEGSDTFRVKRYFFKKTLLCSFARKAGTDHAAFARGHQESIANYRYTAFQKQNMKEKVKLVPQGNKRDG